MIFLIDEEENEEEEEVETIYETDFKLDEFLQRCDMARQNISDILIYLYKNYLTIFLAIFLKILFNFIIKLRRKILLKFIL